MAAEQRSCELIEKIFDKKVNEKLSANVKLCHVFKDGYGESNVIFATTDDEVYAFGRWGHAFALLAERDNSKVCEAIKVHELCGKRIVKFSNSYYHVLALNADGNVFAWGSNKNGQLGYNADDKCYVPKQIQTLSNIIDISCGSNHSLILNKSGNVFAFGSNKFGQCGNELNVEKQFTPYKIEGLGVKKVISIKCGEYHCVALTDSNEVYAWGWNYWGQLGVNSRQNHYVAQRIWNLDKIRIKQIECGKHYTLLLSYDGEVYACGENKNGELGLGNETGGEMLIKKVNIDEKIERIYANMQCVTSFAMSEANDKYYVWGFVWQGGPYRRYLQPNLIEVKYKSVEDAIFTINEITYGTIHREGNSAESVSLIKINNYIDDYNEMRFIAGGGFGFVFKAEAKCDNIVYAIKKIPHMELDVRIMRELDIMKRMNESGFTVKLFSYWTENNYYLNNDVMHSSNLINMKSISINNSNVYKLDSSFSPQLLHMQMELCVKSLKEVMRELSNITLINYFIKTQLFIEIVEAVNYLHTRSPSPIIHRDLKPENILICEPTPLNERFIRLADFGLAVIHEYSQQSHTDFIGTYKYMAPEVRNNKKYDVKADIYSLGIIAEESFNFNRVNEQFERKYEHMKGFIEKMKSDEHMRPKCEYILRMKRLWALELKDIEDDQEFMQINSSRNYYSIEDNFIKFFVKYKKLNKR